MRRPMLTRGEGFEPLESRHVRSWIKLWKGV